MKILVLGGSGYIGSELCKELGAVSFDLKEGQDIRNPSAVIPFLYQADAVVHLAGTSMDPLFEKDPYLTWSSNYLANDLISKVLRNTGKRIVYASSGSVYGRHEGVCREDGPVNPLTLYAQTKSLSEELFLRPDVNGVVFRFATAYGLAPFTRYDTIVNSMAKAAKSGVIKVMGGQKRRSVVHVKDIVKGIEMALQVKDPKYRLMNLGSNEQNLTVKEIAERVAAVTKAQIVESPDLSGDDRSYAINYDRITEFGFTPSYTIEDGVREIYGSL